MTNREWVNSLSNKKFVKLDISNNCAFCIYKNLQECGGNDCSEGIIAWLGLEHEEDTDG